MTIKTESLYDIFIKFDVPRKLVTLIRTYLDVTQIKVKIGNHLSSSFPIENGLKEGDALHFNKKSNTIKFHCNSY